MRSGSQICFLSASAIDKIFGALLNRNVMSNPCSGTLVLAVAWDDRFSCCLPDHSCDRSLFSDRSIHSPLVGYLVLVPFFSAIYRHQIVGALLESRVASVLIAPGTALALYRFVRSPTPTWGSFALLLVVTCYPVAYSMSLPTLDLFVAGL